MKRLSNIEQRFNHTTWTASPVNGIDMLHESGNFDIDYTAPKQRNSGREYNYG